MPGACWPRAISNSPWMAKSCMAAGCWCGCGSDKFKSKRNNWLLIKHRDKYARDGNGEAMLEKDHSVASGRGMKAIEAGTGKKPKPFMRAKAFKADAVWQSKGANRTQGRRTRTGRSQDRSTRCQNSSAPQL